MHASVILFIFFWYSMSFLNLLLSDNHQFLKIVVYYFFHFGEADCETRYCFVAQAGLEVICSSNLPKIHNPELTIFQFQHPKCCNCKCVCTTTTCGVRYFYKYLIYYVLCFPSDSPVEHSCQGPLTKTLLIYATLFF